MGSVVWRGVLLLGNMRRLSMGLRFGFLLGEFYLSIYFWGWDWVELSLGA